MEDRLNELFRLRGWNLILIMIRHQIYNSRKIEKNSLLLSIHGQI